MHFLDKFLKTDYQLDKIAKQLLDWYAQNKRDLPWRNTRNPYKIWLSEIILQQTRVDQGLDYYLKFEQNYPTIDSLAIDSINNVLKLWQGLGYYSRARNLHQTAQVIKNEHNSTFPIKFTELLKLKGVGQYTAAAIASIAFDEKVAVLDGNVYRVLSRYFGIYTPIDAKHAKKEFFELANSIVPKSNSGDYNQAVMELGAIICTPRNPKCDDCPIAKNCYARLKNAQHNLPVKEKKTKVTERHFNYMLVLNGNNTFIHQRLKKDIWQNLFELPLLEKTDELESESKKFVKHFGLKKTDLFKHKVYSAKHVLSHQIIHADFYLINSKINTTSKQFKKVKLANLETYAVSRLTEKFLETGFFRKEVLKKTGTK
jgi:A/G-specific adenine glycosylase